MTGNKKSENKERRPLDDDSAALVSTAIGQKLKRLYDDVAQEPVPDRFAELLKQLEAQEKKK